MKQTVLNNSYYYKLCFDSKFILTNDKFAQPKKEVNKMQYI